MRGNTVILEKTPEGAEGAEAIVLLKLSEEEERHIIERQKAMLEKGFAIGKLRYKKREKGKGSNARLPGEKGYRMRGASSVAPGDLTIAKEFVRRLAERIDSGRFQVTLFGSRARGDADEESDLDLLVRLKENDPEGVVKAVVSHIACDLTLEHGVLVAAFVADEIFLKQHEEFSFLETVEKEGVPL